MERLLFGPIIGVLLLIYAGFCMFKGGTHVRGKGWVTKEAARKSYIFNQVMYYILGIFMIFGSLLYR